MSDLVAILGYGRFGRALGGLLSEAGILHRAHDPGAEVPAEYRADSIHDLVKTAAFVALAVPVTRMRAALADLLPHLSPDQVVFDVGSVKVFPAAALAEVLGDAIPWCATHPLFGPQSLALAERPLRVVVCPAPEQFPRARGATARVRELYRRIGCEVIEQTAEGHDRVMAHTHALTFFVAKGMIDAGAGMDVPFAPPSFQAMSRAIETVRADAGHLFAAIARDNPFATEARKQLVQALSAIDGALDRPWRRRTRGGRTLSSWPRARACARPAARAALPSRPTSPAGSRFPISASDLPSSNRRASTSTRSIANRSPPRTAHAALAARRPSQGKARRARARRDARGRGHGRTAGVGRGARARYRGRRGRVPRDHDDVATRAARVDPARALTLPRRAGEGGGVNARGRTARPSCHGASQSARARSV